ncbi:MAG TPA: hypothetical protein VHT34_02755, partial [Clostridia bacterium]|nr:hypothetical protein [Clostridia bacterium]
MDKFQRNERIAALTKILSDAPCKVFTLGSFSEMFSSAKSTISEDIDHIKQSFVKFASLVPKDGYVVACADDPNTV